MDKPVDIEGMQILLDKSEIEKADIKSHFCNLVAILDRDGGQAQIGETIEQTYKRVMTQAAILTQNFDKEHRTNQSAESLKAKLADHKVCCQVFITVRRNEIQEVLAALATAERVRDAFSDRIDHLNQRHEEDEAYRQHMIAERDEALGKLAVCEEHCALAEKRATDERADVMEHLDEEYQRCKKLLRNEYCIGLADEYCIGFADAYSKAFSVIKRGAHEGMAKKGK